MRLLWTSACLQLRRTTERIVNKTIEHDAVGPRSQVINKAGDMGKGQIDCTTRDVDITKKESAGDVHAFGGDGIAFRLLKLAAGTLQCADLCAGKQDFAPCLETIVQMNGPRDSHPIGADGITVRILKLAAGTLQIASNLCAEQPDFAPRLEINPLLDFVLSREKRSHNDRSCDGYAVSAHGTAIRILKSTTGTRQIAADLRTAKADFATCQERVPHENGSIDGYAIGADGVTVSIFGSAAGTLQIPSNLCAEQSDFALCPEAVPQKDSSRDGYAIGLDGTAFRILKSAAGAIEVAADLRSDKSNFAQRLKAAPHIHIGVALQTIGEQPPHKTPFQREGSTAFRS
ncbi:MAG: hypothetical protein IRZ23_08165 [Acetobacteraceae bacterium]|nr:hypothetical protein [Acetobacteraceae bacterium]